MIMHEDDVKSLAKSATKIRGVIRSIPEPTAYYEVCDKEIFMGSGDYSRAQTALLYCQVEVALTLLSGLQQPGPDHDGAPTRADLDRLIADITAALGGKHLLKDKEGPIKKAEEPIVSGSMAVPSWAKLSAKDRAAEAGMYSRLFMDEMSSFEDD
jgi:hypothetical protein